MSIWAIVYLVGLAACIVAIGYLEPRDLMLSVGAALAWPVVVTFVLLGYCGHLVRRAVRGE